jgi:hypothetical protein
MARRTKVTGELKSTGRAALKQYDRVTGAASDAVGSILQLPRQWAGAIVGEKNPKPYKVTKDWEFWLKDGEIYRNARGNRGPISDTGMPANVRWESSKAHFDHYFGKGTFLRRHNRKRCIYNPAKFDRCVRDVKAHASGPVNAYAVCTAAGTRNPQAPTMEELRAAVTAAGYHLGNSFEDAQLIYSASAETMGPATYGHPAFEALYHKDTGWLTVGDTHTFAPNPKKGKSRFERCVESVTAGGSADDPRAVCAAAGRAKYGQAEMTRRSVAGRRRATRGNPPNPQEAAREMYESFHGKPAEGETLVEEEFHVHEHLSPLGVLTEFKVATITGLDATLATSEGEKDAGDYDETAARPGTVFLCSNEQGTQLYFVGGDQSLDLARLKFTGDLVKDDMVIGILYEVTYRTRKKFDKFQLTEYYHELGEETGDQPFLRYDSLSPHLAISGGKYKIKMPLIGMSPGIEN